MLSLQGALVISLLIVVGPQIIVKYKYFDDYLLHLHKYEQSILIREVEIKVSEKLPIRTGQHRSKDEQCCMLGQMAGQKGFHCFARFYASRILYRNYNRAHNKKITTLLKGKSDPITDKLMRTFGQCVTNRSNIFHKCCRHAALKDRY